MSRGPQFKYVKPTEAQQRALLKLTSEWQSAYDLDENLNILDALVKRGLASVKYTTGRTTEESIHYKVR